MSKDTLSFNGTLVAATQNTNKLQEITEIFNPYGIQVSPADASIQVEETGTSYEENAGLKALAVARSMNCFAVGDDSGFEIDALDGQPGLYSNRFYDGSDVEKNNHVLKLLDGKTNRAAKFVAAVCFTGPDGPKKLFRAELSGAVADIPRGSNGFGFDPIFIPDGSELTFAEMDSVEKNRMSHRYKALVLLAEFLQDLK